MPFYHAHARNHAHARFRFRAWYMYLSVLQRTTVSKNKRDCTVPSYSASQLTPKLSPLNLFLNRRWRHLILIETLSYILKRRPPVVKFSTLTLSPFSKLLHQEFEPTLRPFPNNHNVGQSFSLTEIRKSLWRPGCGTLLAILVSCGGEAGAFSLGSGTHAQLSLAICVQINFSTGVQAGSMRRFSGDDNFSNSKH